MNSTYIYELLFERDCLIIPGFGAFVLSSVPASIDTKRGIILPPRKEIAFNRDIMHNDGTLANYLSLTLHISLDEALGMVNDYANELNSQLNKCGHVNINGVGSIHTIGPSLTFIADKDNNFDINSFGYLPVDIPVKTQHTNTTYSFRKVAAAVAVVTSLFFISPDVSDNKVDSYTQANIAASLFTPSENNSVSVADNNDSDNTTIPEQPTEVFHIIVASFPKNTEADNYITNMKKRGIDGLVKVTSGKRVRISAGTFNNYDEAVANNNAFHKIRGFENAWILRDKQ